MTPNELQKTIEMAGSAAIESGPIKDLAVFRSAHGQAQLAGIDHLEVSDEIFDFLCNGQDTAYINYGNPAVKVYRAGSKAQLDRIEKMTLDQRAKHLADEWRAANPDKV